MKPKDGSARQPVSGRSVSGRPATHLWNSRLPMEWMDPMSWRLPSGKALAEFALQSGFLAPLMMSAPGIRRKKTPQAPVQPEELPGVVDKQWREGPGASGTFREIR